MRIIGGEYRSRLIEMPKGAEIRPTQDRVREAVFNLITPRMNGATVLDLFAGSGAFGIESISRGAVRAIFVENNSKCLETIQANLDSLDIPEACYEVVRANALSVFGRLAQAGERFDIIFLDPPYYRDMARKCLISIDSYDILTPNSLVVIEHFKKDLLTFDLKQLVFEKERRYGDTIISIYRKINDNEDEDRDIPRHI